jgi:hypothetical protein
MVTTCFAAQLEMEMRDRQCPACLGFSAALAGFPLLQACS